MTSPENLYRIHEKLRNNKMAGEDYYKTLGVTKEASDNEIKKAYRKLAMKYHPDKTKGDKSAEETFKKISEAYAVLSDKDKRAEYDTYGSTGFHQRYSQEDIFKNFNFSDIFKDFGFSNFGFGGPFSQGMGGRGRTQQPKGSDLIYEMPLTLKEIETGVNKTISLQHDGRSEQISVKIPRGMIEGKKLRLTGKGQASPYGGPSGDLFIKVKILKDPVFSSENYDLHIQKTIKLSEALRGTNISVPTLNDKEISLKIPPGTQHKTKMRLSGLGLPQMNSSQKGDLYVLINLKIPKNFTEEQIEAIEKLSESGL